MRREDSISALLVNLDRLNPLKRLNRPWYERHCDLPVILRRFLPQGFFAVHGKRNVYQRFAGHFQKAQGFILKVANRYQPVCFGVFSVWEVLNTEEAVFDLLPQARKVSSIWF